MRLFYFDLARELGMTVRELLARADSKELAEWVAYFRIDRKRQQRQELELKAQQGALAIKEKAKGLR